MSIGRVSTYQLNKAFSNQINNTQSKFNKLSNQISSGIKVGSMTDDPVAAGSIIKANKQLEDINTYVSNIKSADSELSVVDNTLKSINDQLAKAHDVAMLVSNGATSVDSVKAYQSELDAIIDNITKLANTKYNDSYLFSGTRTTTSPYTQSAEGLKYDGNDEKRSTLIGENKVQDISFIGMDVFGEAAFTTDSEGVITFDDANSSGMFGALYKLKAAMQDAENVDFDNVQAAMGELDDNISVVTGNRTRVGAMGEVFDDMLATYGNDTINLTELRSNLQDTDLSSAISDWYSLYQSMQASYSIMSQSMQATLLNYI
ncbi:flagellar hook-associated protein FlgL [bacterium]|nr:flagellar hook-associated protein FlgL [bacterium]